MSLTVRRVVTITGLTCNVQACTASVSGGPWPETSGRTHYERLAAAQGWTIWQSGPRRRHYCPDHEPSTPGHHMRQVTPAGAR